MALSHPIYNELKTHDSYQVSRQCFCWRWCFKCQLLPSWCSNHWGDYDCWGLWHKQFTGIHGVFLFYGFYCTTPNSMHVFYCPYSQKLEYSCILNGPWISCFISWADTDFIILFSKLFPVSVVFMNWYHHVNSHNLFSPSFYLFLKYFLKNIYNSTFV